MPFDVMGINVDPQNPIIYRSPPVVSEKHTRPAPRDERLTHIYLIYIYKVYIVYILFACVQSGIIL